MRDLLDAGLAPADELAHVRAEIRRLRDRETALRRYFLTTPDAVCQGQARRVAVINRTQRRFVPDRLPDAIRADPAYWQDQTLRVVKLIEAPPPRGPTFAQGAEDAFDLIEPFD